MNHGDTPNERALAEPPTSDDPGYAAGTPDTAGGGAPMPAADGYADAFRALQAQMLEAHRAYTDALTASHQAFLRTSEIAFQHLAELRGTRVGSDAPPAGDTPPPQAQPAPRSAPTAADAQSSVPPSTSVQPAGPSRVAQPASPAPAPESAPPAVAEAASTEPDHENLLLDIVADTTGYPRSMLTLDMKLEADLGIDSIKRVEILSVLQQRVPALAEADTADMASLDSLGAIVDFARRTVGGATPAADAAPAPAATEKPDASGSSDYESLVLGTVADTTGYPRSMLTLDMKLEADLGIDSIKRVEILSVLQQRIPALAEADTAEMASLDSLGAIIDFAHRTIGGGSSPEAATS